MKTQIMGKNGLKTVNLDRRAAIHEKCLNCSGWYPKDVKNCHFIQCFLYPFRTGDGKQDFKMRNRAIRSYCRRCMNGQLGEVSKCVSNDCPLFLFRGGEILYDNDIMTISFEEFHFIHNGFKKKVANE